MRCNLYRSLPATALLIMGMYLNTFAQQADSTKNQQKVTDSSQVYFFNNDFEKLGSLNLHQNDTALAGFQNYNRLFKQNRFFETLGNIGQNYRSLLPFASWSESGFYYGIHSFDHYLYQTDSVKYYKVNKTYTELTYIQGAKKEQNFHAIFSRNIYRSINIGFDFNVMSAPGAYYRQKTNHINFVLTSQFFSRNKRYGIIADFTVNRLRNYENGGLKNDSLFKHNIESNRQVIPVNLLTAQNRIKESGFYMKHYFDLNRHLKNDKDTSLDARKRVELGRITHSFQYNRQIQNFIDLQPDSGFFPPPVIDTVRTYDSLTIKKFSSDVVWSNPSFKPNRQLRVFHIEAGIRHQYTEVSMHGVKHYFRQFIPHAEIDFTPFSNLNLKAQADYVLGDYNESDLSLRVRLSTTLGTQSRNAGIIALTGNYLRKQPGWFYAYYRGNNFQWDTTWLKQSLITGGFSYTLKFIETGVTVSRINNFIYLDSLSLPGQYQAEFGYINLYLNGNINLWRFKFTAKFVYQNVQGTTILHLPVFMGNLGIYYTQPLFNEAATLQPGLNFFYNTSYYADNYNPALRSFYLQNRKEIGNYLYMDVFINLKIQRARFFFTYTHFNASFMGREYYTTPSYPMQDGAFKFGVAWRFHD
ncbi:MAG: putative porin [Bacteroidales bacterium]|nr:putative porin [Bacteroidales bacterium]